jgi:hypothetical protein
VIKHSELIYEIMLKRGIVVPEYYDEEDHLQPSSAIGHAKMADPEAR